MFWQTTLTSHCPGERESERKILLKKKNLIFFLNQVFSVLETCFVQKVEEIRVNKIKKSGILFQNVLLSLL